ncbi:unnamed protein product, partial [Ectocarpus fasciculatus]
MYSPAFSFRSQNESRSSFTSSFRWRTCPPPSNSGRPSRETSTTRGKTILKYNVLSRSQAERTETGLASQTPLRRMRLHTRVGSQLSRPITPALPASSRLRASIATIS